MRDSFLAVDAATDVGALARSSSRTRGAGRDATRLDPRPAIGIKELDATRSSSPARHARPALRSPLGAIAKGAQHVVVTGLAVDRVL